MPTQKPLGASPSVSAKAEKRSDMLASGTAGKSTSDMPTLSASGMTKAEALAVSWTGIEALAKMKQAVIYRHRRTGRVWVELLAVELTREHGLKVLAGNK